MKSFLKLRPLKDQRENRLGAGHGWVCGLESDRSELQFWLHALISVGTGLLG